MASRYTQNDYLYASARILAREASLPGKEVLMSLLDLGSVQEIAEALVQHGFAKRLLEDGSYDTEAMLTARLKEELQTVRSLAKSSAVIAPFALPYDCHNIKSCLKCRQRAISPQPLLLPLGSVETDVLQRALDEGDYAKLPPHMAAAIPEAVATFERTADPREIDFILDRACFEDLCDATADLPFARELVAQRADLTNILICLRLIRENNPYLAPALLQKTMVTGGRLDAAFFQEALREGEKQLANMLVTTPYAALLQTKGARTAAAVEKNADDLLMRTLTRVKFIPFGGEVPLAYLLAFESAIKNLRILLAGRAAGLPRDVILERVRESYV